MESKKFNWNKLFNALIAGIAIILASIFIGICFIVPTTTSVKASLSKEDINNLNIHFVSAKTKIRQATGYNKVRLLGNSKSSDDSNQNYFYSYNYNYKIINHDSTQFETQLYSNTGETNKLDNYSSENGNVYLSTDKGGKVSIYEDIETKYTDNSFINTNAHSFLNTISSDIQEIFYDEIDNGDFVLLNNYTPYTQDTSFNVENFYLSFGTPYINGQKDTSPLYNLQVQGMLYNSTGSHLLSLNEVQNIDLENDKTVRYWYQYFDLRSLKAHKTVDPNSEICDIEDQQGKYVITFEFNKYNINEKGELEVGQDQTFEYTFYLIDSANYDVTPKINNATLGYMKQNELREYFFNYTTQNPYITYNPQKFNLSYTKENREVTENITSSYALNYYQIDGNVYPLGILSFTDGSKYKKQVFILTYYNKERTLVEYLYLSSNSESKVTLGTNYSDIENLVTNGTLKFEYKKSLYLTVDETNATQTTYETKTYVTKDYEQFGLLFGNKDTELTASQIQGKLTQMDANPTFERIVVTSDGAYKYSCTGVDEYTVATMTNHSLTISETEDIEEVKNNGIIFNKIDFNTTGTLDETSTKYQLIDDNGTYKLQKSYMQGGSQVFTDIALSNIASDGTYELVDPIDKIISIVYTCVNSEVTKLEFIQNIYSTTIINANSNILNKVLYPNQIQIETTYNLEFDTLGVYTFDYKYNCANYSEPYTIVTTNDLSNSTNILDIQDIDIKNSTPSTSSVTDDEDDDILYLNVWGYLDNSNSVTLAGTQYTYDAKSDKLKIGENSPESLSELQKGKNDVIFGKTNTTAYYTVSTDAKGRYILNIKYRIAVLHSKLTLDKSTYSLSGTDYIVDSTLKTKTIYDFEKNYSSTEWDPITFVNANIENSAEWGKILSTLEYLEEHNNLVTTTYTTTKPNLNGDILHVLGSETYFNKTDTLSDTGYSKLKLIDSKTNNNYISDVTNYYTNGVPDSRDVGVKASSFKGFLNTAITNGFDAKNNLIVTDITPVFFKNLSSLLYSGKVSLSYIYRYPNYQIKSDGTIDYGDCITDIYTKDTYCQFDGLYEIVILYKYDAYKSLVSGKDYNNTVFYQLITFAIDNSSPKLDIKIQDINDIDHDENTDEYIEDLGLKKYTNRNVQLSWNIPTYFQNEVYLDIERETFDGLTSNNFKATYIQNSLNTSSSTGNVTYANTITSTDKDDNKYYVTITSSNLYNSNGNYKVTLHYSSRGASTVSEKFVVDKENISGLKTLPVIQVTGGYAVDEDSYDTSLAETKQIINKNFTFRYDAKASGAKIYTYWYKIDLNLTNDEKVLNFDGETAITTNYEVYGKNIENISSANQYIYNYPEDDMVQGANYFASDSSALYLFNMIDEAGNECRYVVFYDKTTPRFTIEPIPNNTYNVVNNTSKVILGDYKAIKIATVNSSYEIKLDEQVDNYSKNKGLDKLQETIGYINSNSNFNDTQVKLIDGNYYLLLPIDSFYVRDLNSNTIQSYDSSNGTNVIPNEYYFFPSNPVITDEEGTKIKLLKDTNTDQYLTAKISSDIKYTTVKNSYNIDVEKYIIASSADNTNIKYYGAIGKTKYGEYTYTISDRLGNQIDGYIWVNPDKTQSWGYGIFDTKTSEDNLTNAINLGASGSYSASKLYISSKKPSENVPDYTLTYKYYGFNVEQYTTLFENYNLTDVKYWNNDNKAGLTNDKITIVDQQSYIELVFTSKLNPSEQISHFIEVTNRFGKESPQHSYPYDMDGIYPIVNSQGEPEHIYTNDIGSYTNPSESDRIYSSIINPNADETGKVNGSVTQEGLYIFKREYKEIFDQNELGEDEQIIYLIYYVDRTGVINVTTSQDFGYILGSNYTNSSLKKYINQDTIKNAQVVADTTSTASNSHYKSEDLFSTNKIKVQFNLTYDKYNFDKFVNDFENNISTSLADNLKNYLDVYLLNKSHFSLNLYKLNLTIAKGISSSEVNILSETSSGTMDINKSAYSKYLGTGSELGRLNSYNFFFEDKYSSPYKIYIQDSSGYRHESANGGIISNYQSNELDMSFSIKHTAPDGDAYGKYYGRHNYDVVYEDYKDSNGNTETRYNLLGKYLAEGQLDHFDVKSYGIASDNDGQVVKLYSSNNETLIFTFQITNDDTKAQIDPNNIQIYQKQVGVDSNLIFNRVNGRCDDKNGTCAVDATRMQSAFISNTIDGVTYYAIIIFDNNLDDITNNSDTNYLNYRLLDSNNNPDSQNYYVVINYIGDKDNYVKEDNSGNNAYYYKSTFEITIDRNKPIYNLTKLMSQDNYVYNNQKETITKDNYETLFNKYKTYYNFYTDSEYDFERSDLENYFFALDYREDTSFVFERISELDSNDGIFIRRLTNNSAGQFSFPTDYKFSKTPDDYKTYYNATYLQGHKQFSADNSETVTIYSGEITDTEKYYYVKFDTFEAGKYELKVSDLYNNGILVVDNYYEIIERDEAGNYRVYAVYLPKYQETQVTYEYKVNNSSKFTPETLRYNTNTVVSISGIDFNLKEITTHDFYLRSNLKISSTNLNEMVFVTYDPVNRCIYVKNSNNTIKDTITNVSHADFTTKFISTINNLIKTYNDLVSDTSSDKYTKYGHQITLEIVDRLGVKSQTYSDDLYNYEITYNVAGSVLAPIFKNNSTTFTMEIPAKTGTTNIKQVRAFVFAGDWSPKDPDDKQNSFYKTESELINGATYTLGKGVYKFEIIDNFNRINYYFYEFGSSTIQTGGVLRYSDNNVLYSDGYNYTGKSAMFIYDNSVYDIYIKFIGDVTEDGVSYTYPDSDTDPKIIYSGNKTYSDEYLSTYGLSIATIDNITTITFTGISDSDLTKYHIKTIPATISSQYGYTWGKEATDNNIMTYDYKLAIYTAVQSIVIRNSNGNALDTSGVLNLSEDFEVTLAWTNGYQPDKQIDFGAKVILENLDNGQIIKNGTSYIITDAGNYRAYVINTLNTKSNIIKFTRSEGDIGIYSVFAINNNVQTKLNPSALVSTHEYADNEEGQTRQIIEFNYFTTLDYFSFVNQITNSQISIENDLRNEGGHTFEITDVAIDRLATKYLDVQVKSDLNIFVDLFDLAIDDSLVPYAEFRVYTKNGDEVYTYRFVKVYFVETSDYNLTGTTVTTNEDTQTNIYGSSSIIKRPDSILLVTFNFRDNNLSPINGNTIYVDRYFNNELVETQSFSDMDTEYKVSYTLTQVGLHKFVVRDLAGRVQKFGNNMSSALQIYLINQILFTVNDSTPINNQIFNGLVNIKVQSTLAGITLYNTRTLGVSVIRNGQEISITNPTEFTFSEAGSYTVKMIATTVLSDENTSVADQEISTTYKFTIIKTNVAQKSFNVSKGTGFVIEKIIKIVNNERQEVTEKYRNSVTIKLAKSDVDLLGSDKTTLIKKMSSTDYIYAENYNASQEYTYVIVRDQNQNQFEGYIRTSDITAYKDSLLWLSFENEGNSNFEITLKYYNSTIKNYQAFTFDVWINNDQPVIISNITNGSATKDTITLNFNPGIIYTQVGNCKIYVNDKEYLSIDENSERIVQTLTITQKGKYNIEIVSDDGSLISSYQFSKNDPINNTTKIILICVACGVVVLVVLFLLVRRKGKYR